jgi:FG-GAP repeat protein
MKHQLCKHTSHSSLMGFTLLLGLAVSSLTSACSGDYPLEGQGFPSKGWVDESTGVAVGLPPPDFTLDVNGGAGPGSLAFVGDLDGDGRDEMAALRSNYDATQAVSVHLRYGGPRPENDLDVFAFDQSGADLMLTGVDATAFRVAPGGDVDGDGYADLLLGNGACNTQQEGAGSYVVYGGPERLREASSLLDVAAHFVPGPRPGPETTEDVSCNGVSFMGRAGDLDGDGIDDLVITRAPLQTNDGESHTRTGEGVYVFYGRAQRFSGDIALASADAVFNLAQPLDALPVGDVNGDGRVDLMVVQETGSYFVPGTSQRYSGTLDLPSHSTFLADIYMDGYSWHPMDLDGDGLNDLLVFRQNYGLQVLYGRSGLFADGYDPSQVDATLQHGENPYQVFPAGDRDGDGRDELFDQFYVPEGPVPFSNSEGAFSHGSSTRLSGSFSFPESEVVARSGGVRFPKDPRRVLQSTVAGGDLDGDGAADLFTVSSLHMTVGETTFSGSATQIHVHYGVLAAERAPAVR